MGVFDGVRTWRDRKKAAASAEVASWRLGRKFLYLCLIATVLFGLYAWAVWSLEYSTGSRAGSVRKISHRGFMFKTWEGELQMSGVVSPSDNGETMQGIVNGGNVWFFSVDNGQTEVIKKLEEAMLNRKHVALHYEEKYTKIFFRGDTKYFITKVEIKD